jgi:hypothetical protein
MHLIYLDESGNSGGNLQDPQQPVFVLGALVVHETVWQPVERDLEAAVIMHLPLSNPDAVEIHGGDLRHGTGPFKGVSVSTRLALRNEWLRIAHRHGLRFIYRAIVKKRYEAWMGRALGRSMLVNPHLAAFPLVAQVVNQLLRGCNAAALGIFISDENHEVVGDLERFLRLLRVTPGALHLDCIIEKGFFIDSKQSRLLQLADLCTLQVRKSEERKLGLPPKRIDDEGILLTDPLIHRGDESLADVIQWLQQVQK